MGSTVWKATDNLFDLDEDDCEDGRKPAAVDTAVARPATSTGADDNEDSPKLPDGSARPIGYFNEYDEFVYDNLSEEQEAYLAYDSQKCNICLKYSCSGNCCEQEEESENESVRGNESDDDDEN